MASGDYELAEGTLLGMGNPLLDMQTRVEKAFLDKWNLKENDAILADDSHVAMFEELAKTHEIEYVPGGATQNALRVCQWILDEPHRVTFFGAVGKDKYADVLREKASAAGVNVQYQVNEAVKTGTCGVLLYENFRSLCAHLAAANTFTIEHLDVEANKASVEKAKFYYIAGFFLTVCPPAIMRVAKHAAENNKVFMMNLAAPFISQFFTQPLMEALPYIDILFGNESEAAAFAEANKFDTTCVKEIAKKIAELPKVNQNRKRTVVITQGDEPTIVVENGELFEYPIIPLTKEQLVDTNGAGDAFVGGFLAEYIRGKPIPDAIKCGNFAASTIIQQNGCTYPEKCEYQP
ncbi:hypothetical protein QR680_002401 [Steinernema hermaphroditum]|uniref:Adenosine kinase n=1 Tax=Steinernema hermaphroditum TaxID=289476 RepID=A0AA39H2J9_9BILA|nr:hypothetical protein QR680_002401 [Steinernema hermaphroditum]